MKTDRRQTKNGNASKSLLIAHSYPGKEKREQETLSINAVQSLDIQQRQYLTLHELSKAIASHRNLSDLFHELAANLHHIFEFQSISVMMHDESQDVMRLHILESSEPAFQQAPSEIPIDGSITGWVWRNQQPVVVSDVDEETRFPMAQVLRGKFPVKSFCSLPLTTAHRRVGVLNIVSDKSGVYDKLDLEFARLVAAQIAIALDNAFNFQEAQCYQRQLARERDRSELLLEVNNMLVSNLNLRELLSALSLCLRKVVPHDAAGLALYDYSINQLRISALEFPTKENLFVEGEIIPLEESPAGRAFTTRKTVVMKDAGNPESPVGKRFAAAGVKSCCLIPLVSHDRGLGVLSVASLRENAFTSDDSELLNQIAKQVSIAVENACAFRKIETLKNRLEEEKLYLEEEIRTEYNFEEIIGGSPALRRVLQDVETVARTDSNVLIYGETGTGKELLARAIHNLSLRKERTLVKVNCAAIPTGLLESEMFGHEKGAFTGAIERRIGRFELAHQGTLFLDEVEDIPLELQPKLLRMLQEQEFERLGSSRTIRVAVRIVAATNLDLARLVAEKKFRSDLFYRLNVFPITLPPLRERAEDIPMLAHFFAQKFAQQMRKPIERIPAEGMAALTAYSWPGNIRELQNLIERAVILTRGRALEIPLAELRQSANFGAPGISDMPEAAEAHDQTKTGTLKDVEREHILRALNESNWVVGGPNGAAARLGLNRTTLNHRMRKLGIKRPR
jgi:formate hydrogenlyase transcriptional activator